MIIRLESLQKIRTVYIYLVVVRHCQETNLKKQILISLLSSELSLWDRQNKEG